MYLVDTLQFWKTEKNAVVITVIIDNFYFYLKNLYRMNFSLYRKQKQNRKMGKCYNLKLSRHLSWEFLVCQLVTIHHTDCRVTLHLE